MAKQNKPSPTCAAFGPFGGIDTRDAHNSTKSAADVVNFRVADNGTLVKREGSHPVLHLDAPIRAQWTGKLFGIQCTVLICSHNILCYSSGFGKARVIGTLSTSSTEVQLFFYRDRLYLVDGEMIYEIRENEIAPIEPYAPLIGKDWPTTEIGEIHEPRSLLTRHARIEYLIQENPSVFLRTCYSVESIEAIYVNKRKIDPADYSYEDSSHSIVLQGLWPGDRVRVYLTYASSSDRVEDNRYSPFHCSRVDIFGDTTNNRLFFWNGTNPSIFYPSSYVSETSLEASRFFLPDSVPLYIPEGATCMLGDGQYRLTGFVRQYDRLLILSEHEVWVADTEALSAQKFVAKPVHPHVGCATIGGAGAWENTPIVIDARGIYRFTADTDDYNEGNAIRICDPVRPLFSATFLQAAHVFSCRTRGEIWFYDPFNRGSGIWIYHPSSGNWYRFSGIWLNGLFEIAGRLYFHNDQGIFVFDEADRVDTDVNGNEREIVAEYHTHLLEYDSAAQKRFRSLTLCADGKGTDIEVSLCGDGLGALSCHFAVEGAHNILTRRLCSGRFRYATLSLRASGTAKTTVYYLVSDVC